MAWVSKSLHICSSSRSEIRQAAPTLSFPPHLEGLRREPEVGRILVSAVIWTAARLFPARIDRYSRRLERGLSLSWTLPTRLATKRLHLPGIHRGSFAVGVGSRSTVRLAGCDCQEVRRVGMQWEAVGFTYEMLPRACEGSLGDPA